MTAESVAAYAVINARLAPLITALGEQVDIDLTVAVATAMTAEQRRDWHDGEDCMRLRDPAARYGRDLDAEWLAEVLDEAFPHEASIDDGDYD